MANYYLVETTRGPTWDDDKPRREQAEWDAHAAFMDGLVEDDFMVLGDPVCELDGDQALLVVDADSEQEARTRMAPDPWADGVLSIRSVRPWTFGCAVLSAHECGCEFLDAHCNRAGGSG